MRAPLTSTNLLSGAVPTTVSNHLGAGGTTPFSWPSGPSVAVKSCESCCGSGIGSAPFRTRAQGLEDARPRHDRALTAPDAAFDGIEIVVLAHDFRGTLDPI